MRSKSYQTIFTHYDIFITNAFGPARSIGSIENGLVPGAQIKLSIPNDIYNVIPGRASTLEEYAERHVRPNGVSSIGDGKFFRSHYKEIFAGLYKNWIVTHIIVISNGCHITFVNTDTLGSTEEIREYSLFIDADCEESLQVEVFAPDHTPEDYRIEGCNLMEIEGERAIRSYKFYMPEDKERFPFPMASIQEFAL